MLLLLHSAGAAAVLFCAGCVLVSGENNDTSSTHGDCPDFDLYSCWMASNYSVNCNEAYDNHNCTYCKCEAFGINPFTQSIPEGCPQFDDYECVMNSSASAVCYRDTDSDHCPYCKCESLGPIHQPCPAVDTESCQRGHGCRVTKDMMGCQYCDCFGTGSGGSAEMNNTVREMIQVLQTLGVNLEDFISGLEMVLDELRQYQNSMRNGTHHGNWNSHGSGDWDSKDDNPNSYVDDWNSDENENSTWFGGNDGKSDYDYDDDDDDDDDNNLSSHGVNNSSSSQRNPNSHDYDKFKKALGMLFRR
ncbi:hypothetical protein ACOMHN_014155 [Nucella lapillus]